MLKGKKILLGVTGSIAAYKSALIVRNLVKAGCEVKVVLTESGAEFITPLTLSTLSKNPVVTSFVDDEEAVWNNHVELGLWADLFLIAPATANTLAKMAEGRSDNILVATYLSARCPVVIAPAMDVDMYQHAATARSLEQLINDGVHVIDAEDGELASGLVGAGRLAEPEHIHEFLEAFFDQRMPLKGKRVLVTAGPTFEPIDAVRFIGNHSSGKMGYEITGRLAELGAHVILVSGPTHLPTPDGDVKRIDVTTAQEMYDAATTAFENADWGILSAAVADFRPANPAEKKIKKEDGGLHEIALEQTQDILKTLGQRKTNGQVLVGFALETDNELENARKKLAAKNLDMIVLNSLADEGAGFGGDTNRIQIIDKDNNVESFELKSKRAVACDIVAKIENLVHA